MPKHIFSFALKLQLPSSKDDSDITETHKKTKKPKNKQVEVQSTPPPFQINTQQILQRATAPESLKRPVMLHGGIMERIGWEWCTSEVNVYK